MKFKQEIQEYKLEQKNAPLKKSVINLEVSVLEIISCFVFRVAV